MSSEKEALLQMECPVFARHLIRCLTYTVSYATTQGFWVKHSRYPGHTAVLTGLGVNEGMHALVIIISSDWISVYNITGTFKLLIG